MRQPVHFDEDAIGRAFDQMAAAAEAALGASPTPDMRLQMLFMREVARPAYLVLARAANEGAAPPDLLYAVSGVLANIVEYASKMVAGENQSQEIGHKIFQVAREQFEENQTAAAGPLHATCTIAGIRGGRA